MAKQAKGSRITGTIGNMTFYVMDGQGYVRAKSSLTAKRVLKDKKFESTRKHASDMGRASRIGSSVYRLLPLDLKGRWQYRAIAGEAASMLYKGKTEQEVTAFLMNKYIHGPQCVTEVSVAQSGETNFFFASKQTRTTLWKIFRDRWEEQDKPVSVFKRIWERRGVFKNYEVPKRLGFVRVV